MAFLNLIKIRVTLQMQIPPHFFARHLPASPQLVGDALAQQVNDYQQKQQLGYYPALEFLQRQQEQGESIQPVDSDLLDAVYNIAWFAGNSVREEIVVRLRGLFSHMDIESLQCLAFTMPAVRPSHAEALDKLAAHYTPIHFRSSLMLSSFYKLKNAQEKQTFETEMEGVTRKKILRNLSRSFATLEITSTKRV